MEKSVAYKDKHHKVRADNLLDLYIKAAEKFASLAVNPEYLSYQEIFEVEKLRYLHNIYLNSLNETELTVYNEQIDAMYIHGTTAIEGNTLTLHETYYLLTEGIVPKKSLREINEVQNYKSVKIYTSNYKGKINLKFIKKLHALIMNNIDFVSAGEFRKTDNVIIVGADISIGLALTIEYDLQDIIKKFYETPNFEQAILFHYNYEKIHPFNDGNGRTGREVVNFLLEKEGYPRLVIPKEAREQYLAALTFGNQNKIEEMIRIFKEMYLNYYKKEIDDLKNLIK